MKEMREGRIEVLKKFHVFQNIEDAIIGWKVLLRLLGFKDKFEVKNGHGKQR